MAFAKKKPPSPPNPFAPSVVWAAALGVLLTATLFFSGELNERSGAFAVLAVLWILAATVRSLLPLLRKEKVPLCVGRIDVCVYLFFGYVVLSIVWNLFPGQGGAPSASLNMLSVWLGLAAAWFLFRQTLSTSRLRTASLRLVLAVVVAEAATGLYQQFVEHPRILRQFETDPISVVAQANPSIEPNTPDWDRFVFRLKTAGPIGTFPLTNTLGGLLGTGFVLMLGILVFQRNDFYRKGSKDTKALSPIPSLCGGGLGWEALRQQTSTQNAPHPSPLPKGEGTRTITFSLRAFVVYSCCAVTLLCFVLTKCRSGFVAVAVGLLLLGILLLQRLDRAWRRWLLIGGGSVFGLLLLISFLFPGKSLLDGAKRSLGFRLEYWQASLGMIRDDPVFGCGSGNFKPTYMKYKLPGSSEEIADPHNFAVELAAVAGIPALILFVIVAGGGIVWCLSSIPNAPLPLPEEEGAVQNSVEKSLYPANVLYWSGLGGGALAFLVSLNAEAQIMFEPILFLFLAVPLVAWAFPLEREVPPRLLAITLIVLLVHLLAAGGISASNTAIIVWLLLALLVECQPKEPEYRLNGALVFLPLFIVSLFVVNHYCLRPVVGALSYTIQLDETPDVLHRLALLREAEMVDPWSADIQEKLATEAFRAWFELPKDESWKAVTQGAQERALRLASRSATLRYVFAERLFAMYAKTGNRTLQNRSLELFAEAIERYPNHAKIRAPFALVLWKSGYKAKAAEQRDVALRLDGLMYHPDQKLPENLRRELLEMGSEAPCTVGDENASDQ